MAARARDTHLFSDFYFNVGAGRIPKHSHVLIRGHIPTFDAADGFVDVAEQGDLTYLSAAETMNIASTSGDDASPSGAGLRTLLIQGVDNTGAAIQEIVTLNGTNNVETTKEYLRVNFMTGLTAGSTGWNAGNVTATASSAGTVQSEMDATESITQGSHYTVPLNYTLMIYQAELNAAKISGGAAPELEFKAYARPGGDGAAWLQLFDKKLDTSVQDELDVFVKVPNAALVERSDIRMRADTDQNGTECRVRLYGILVDNT
jgi:hypothetical protein